MIHFHRYKYIGWVESWYWLAGVSGGVKVHTTIKAKECKVCGKRKEI